MQTVLITHVQPSDISDDAPEGYITILGLDFESTQNTGKIHIVEFLIPEGMTSVFLNYINWDDVVEVMYTDANQTELEMLNVPYVWMRVAAYAVGALK